MSTTHFSGPIKLNDGTEIADASGNLYQAGTQITATAAELNIMDGVTATAAEINVLDASVNAALMTAGTGITAVSAAAPVYSVVKSGGIYITRIVFDLTGLHGGGSAGDIIGKASGTANCHYGKITAAVNGTIYGGTMYCAEVPATGDVDIDLYAATAGTGAQDAAIGDLTETLLLNAGDWTAGTIQGLTAPPAANGYLYLTNGSATDAEYSAGRFVITLYGV